MGIDPAKVKRVPAPECVLFTLDAGNPSLSQTMVKRVEEALGSKHRGKVR